MWVKWQNVCKRNTNCLNVFPFSPSAGPVKISDNNIENIFNININIQGYFSQNIEQDIIAVVGKLLNQQGIVAGGTSNLKDQLMALAKQSESKNLNVDIPASSLGSSFDFGDLSAHIQEALSKKSGNPKAPESQEASSTSSLEDQAKELFQKYLGSNSQPEQ